MEALFSLCASNWRRSGRIPAPHALYSKVLTEPDPDFVEPDLNDMEPDLDDMEPDLDYVEPDLDCVEPDLDHVKPDIEYVEPDKPVFAHKLRCTSGFESTPSRHYLQDDGCRILDPDGDQGE